MVGPDPDEWHECDESGRIEAIYRYHKRMKLKAGNLRLHATIHAVVEAQLAERLESAVSALSRLMEQGLDRHDAIHAIGSVSAEQIYGALSQLEPFDPAVYDDALTSLNAADWLALSDED